MFLLELAYGTDINEMSYFGGIGKDYLASIIVRYIDIENHKSVSYTHLLWRWKDLWPTAYRRD